MLTPERVRGLLAGPEPRLLPDGEVPARATAIPTIRDKVDEVNLSGLGARGDEVAAGSVIRARSHSSRPSS
jgi:hypothetical protein